MADGWYYEKGDAEFGPVPRAKLLELIASGQVSRTSLVWTQGMGDWAPAANVKGLLPAAGTPTAKPAPRPTAAAVAEAEAEAEPAGPGGLRGFWQNLSPAAKVGIMAGGGGTAVMFLAVMVLLVVILLGKGESTKPVVKHAAKAATQQNVSTEPVLKSYTLDPATLSGEAKTQYELGYKQGTNHYAKEFIQSIKGLSPANVAVEVKKALQERDIAIQAGIGNGSKTDPEATITFGRRDGFKAELEKQKIPLPKGDGK